MDYPKPNETLKVVAWFPLKGVAQESAIAEQPELTTINARNVWVYDPSGRDRGCQRPGLTRLWPAG